MDLDLLRPGRHREVAPDAVARGQAGREGEPLAPAGGGVQPVGRDEDARRGLAERPLRHDRVGPAPVPDDGRALPDLRARLARALEERGGERGAADRDAARRRQGEPRLAGHRVDPADRPEQGTVRRVDAGEDPERLERAHAGGEEPLPARLVERSLAALEDEDVETALRGEGGEGEPGRAAADHDRVAHARRHRSSRRARR